MAADHQPIDFAALAAALLERAETLVPQWLPAGRKVGRYWYVGDFDGSAGKSANVNLHTGKWGDNGGGAGDRGGDLVSLYKRIRGHATMLAAARELMGDTGWRAAPAQPKRKVRVTDQDWTPQHPVPDDAPDYRTQWGHYARGTPPMHWEYRDRAGRLLGVVCRFNASDGTKDVQPLSWCHGPNLRRMWRYKAFEQPRPLYGLWRLGPPGAPVPGRVIVVEGEKKADALYAALAETVPVLSWPGGCKAVHLADWSVLPEGTSVLAWPDADAQRDKRTLQLLPAERQPGLAAMRKLQEILDRQGCPVRIVDTGEPGTHADGWDAADAIAEGWTRERLEAFMAVTLPQRLHAVAPAPPPAAYAEGASTPPKAARAGQGGGGGPPDDGRWADHYILARGAIRECVANVSLVLHNHAAWDGVLAFDEFAQRVVKRRPAPYDDENIALPAEWTDVDDTRSAIWLSRRCGFVPGAAMVAEAANEAAHAARFHPVLDWLRTLKHDGTERVDHWLADFFGVPESDYARKVARYYLVGMCMRVLRPGCKFDYCLVLEGAQGRLKSSALRVLAGEWFSDTELDLAHKDSMSYIRGKWLHEFGELGSLARAEELRQKSFLSRQVDEFRPTYGRREIRCPRQVAFAGTTNQWQWNKDPTGGRRFWPVEVGEEVNIAGLANVREQLFAEAFALAQQGERYWPDAEEQRTLFDPEQLSREAPDAFTDLLSAWMNSAEMAVKAHFTLADACMSGLKLDSKSLTKDVQTRVGIALRKLDCERVERRNAVPRFVYKRPARKAASSDQPAQQEGEEEVPF
jgi:predicted P-loop ATPase